MAVFRHYGIGRVYKRVQLLLPLSVVGHAARHAAHERRPAPQQTQRRHGQARRLRREELLTQATVPAPSSPRATAPLSKSCVLSLGATASSAAWFTSTILRCVFCFVVRLAGALVAARRRRAAVGVRVGPHDAARADDVGRVERPMRGGAECTWPRRRLSLVISPLSLLRYGAIAVLYCGTVGRLALSMPTRERRALGSVFRLSWDQLSALPTRT